MLKYSNNKMMSETDFVFLSLARYVVRICVCFHLFLFHFLAKSVEKCSLFLAESHTEIFTFDAHALLNKRNKRLSLQYLLYCPSKIISLSAKLRI